MPVWTVRVASGQEELVEAGMLVTESGSLLAVTGDGLLVCAWAPGEWRTVHCVDGTLPEPNRTIDGPAQHLAPVP